LCFLIEVWAIFDGLVYWLAYLGWLYLRWIRKFWWVRQINLSSFTDFI
jgi:hypothetical protein